MYHTWHRPYKTPIATIDYDDGTDLNGPKSRDKQAQHFHFGHVTGTQITSQRDDKIERSHTQRRKKKGELYTRERKSNVVEQE